MTHTETEELPDDNGLLISVYDEDDKLFAEVFGPNAERHARLIAKSPEMLLMLQAINKIYRIPMTPGRWSMLNEPLSQARALLAEIEGD